MRIALGIEYNGHNYYGWQKQANLPTIQGMLENALTSIAGEPIHLFCAGRTDAGVHALGQVVHFDTTANRDVRAWLFGTNAHLPEAIAVRWAKIVDEDFHARFKALSRSYRYIIYNNSTRPAILNHRVTWHYGFLNVTDMQKAALYLIGEHDFSSFRSAECQSKSPIRNIMSIDITSRDSFIIIDIEANAFLHHMVRNIVGVLIEIGSGRKKVEWCFEVLHKKDRTKASKTSLASGLYLHYVKYPMNYALPEMKRSYIIY